MANYYDILIQSPKVTQEMAAKILNEVASTNLIRSYSYHEGYLYLYVRGIPSIGKIIEEYKIEDNEVEIKDEFDLLNENKISRPNMTLEEFLCITNIEDRYLFASIEEKEHCYRLKLIDSPRIGFSNHDYDELKHLRIKEIVFVENMVAIELKKINA